MHRIGVIIFACTNKQSLETSFKLKSVVVLSYKLTIFQRHRMTGLLVSLSVSFHRLCKLIFLSTVIINGGKKLIITFTYTQN